jgi:adenosylhomocysteine nucleosidase
MHIVAHVPARGEWRALLELVPNLPPVEALPVGEYTTTHLPAPHADVTVVLLRGGVGKINAAASTQYAILTWQPALYAVIGTAGAVDPSLEELDVVLATRTIVHDLNPHLAPTTSTLLTDHTIELASLWDGCELPFPVSNGVVVTGDMDVTHANVGPLRERHSATIADWESGAVAKVCAMNQTPCLIVRGVTDRPSTPPEEQYARFRANTPLVMARAWQVLLACAAHYVQGAKRQA